MRTYKKYKRAKKMIGERIEYKSVDYHCQYTCPRCKEQRVGGIDFKHITRFRCLSCGNELIVDKVITVDKSY